MLSIAAGELNRIMHCNGSVFMPELERPSTEPSDEQREGIAVHYMTAAILRGDFTDPVEFVDRKLPNGVNGTPELADLTQVFIDAIAGRPYVETAKFFVEESFSLPVPNSATLVQGRPDLVVFDPGSSTLYVDDFKTGWRLVEVSPNWTLICYAYAIAVKHQLPVARVVLTIHQPRPHHPDGPRRIFELARADLDAQIVTLFDTLANLENRRTLRTGPHCTKCPKIDLCFAATEAAYNAIDVSSAPFVDNLSAEELSVTLDTLGRAKKAIEDKLTAFEETASSRMKAGEIIPGYAVEQRFGNRTIVAGLSPEVIAMMAGKTVDEITTRKVISPAALERLGVSEYAMKAITYRPPIGEKVVRFDAKKFASKLFDN